MARKVQSAVLYLITLPEDIHEMALHIPDVDEMVGRHVRRTDDVFRLRGEGCVRPLHTVEKALPVSGDRWPSCAIRRTQVHSDQVHSDQVHSSALTCTRLTTSCSSRGAAFSPASMRSSEHARMMRSDEFATNDLPLRESTRDLIAAPPGSCTDATTSRESTLIKWTAPREVPTSA